MVFILSLACLGFALSTASDVQAVCPAPRRGMSVLAPPIVEKDCDPCKQLKSPDTDLHDKCGRYLDRLIIDKLMADCERIVKSADEKQIEAFWENLNIACAAKRGLGSTYVKFVPLSCKCDPCLELTKAGSDFMTKCGSRLKTDDVREIFRTCEQVKNDNEQLSFYLETIKERCYSVTRLHVTLPLCECDVCRLLFLNTSDFMKQCGNRMEPHVISRIKDDCQALTCDPKQHASFRRDLEGMCQHENGVSFEFPRCACEECWLLFQADSDFMTKCGWTMSYEDLRKLIESCYTNLDNLDHFMVFLDKLEIDCVRKTGKFFRKEWCTCEDCLLMEDPTQEIWKKCFAEMSADDKVKTRHDCFDARANGHDLDSFKQRFVDHCEKYAGATSLRYPECGDCTRQDACVVFVVDSSRSINSKEFDEELGFVRDVVQAFGENIGSKKNKIGLIQFSTNAMMSLSLCADANQSVVEEAIDNTKNTKIDRFTSISSGLNMMNTDLARCCLGGDWHKFGIVLTDGDERLSELSPAILMTPDDVTLIAIGFGDYNSATLRIIARGVEANTLEADTAYNLKVLIGDLKDQIGCRK